MFSFLKSLKVQKRFHRGWMASINLELLTRRADNGTTHVVVGSEALSRSALWFAWVKIRGRATLHR